MDISHIKSSLDESDLSIFADVVAYDDIRHAPLRAEIDTWMKPLFRKADLAKIA